MKKTTAILIFIFKKITLFIIITLAIFILVRLVPSTPESQWLSSYNLPHTEENIKWIREEMGLNKPLSIQYFNWITNFFKGDWGRSLTGGGDIFDIFMEKLPYSLSIGLIGILIATIFSFFLGFAAYLRPRGLCDKATSFLAVFSQSVPSFIIAIFIIHFLSVKFHLVYFFTGNVLYPLIAAISITSFYTVGGLSRIAKLAFEEEMSRTYVKFALSHGFTQAQIALYQCYKPVIYKLISAVMSKFAFVFGGSAILEFAFAIPGISYFLVNSMKQSDYTVLQSYMLVVMLWMLFIQILLNTLLLTINGGNGNESYKS